MYSFSRARRWHVALWSDLVTSWQHLFPRRAWEQTGLQKTDYSSDHFRNTWARTSPCHVLSLQSINSQLRSSGQGRGSYLGVQLLRGQIKYWAGASSWCVLTGDVLHSKGARKEELEVRMAQEKDCVLQQLQQNWGVQKTHNIIFWAQRGFGSSLNKINIQPDQQFQLSYRKHHLKSHLDSFNSNTW